MKTKSLFRILPAFALALFVILAGFGQTPKRFFSEVYYFKIKPGHTFTEARAIEKEFKKIHQVQADEGFINGWYMLALQTTTNPNKEYNYITIKTFSDLKYLDNAYPEAAMKGGWGNDYQKKMTDLMKQMGEVYEVAKTELWENFEGAVANPLPSPDKSPIWVATNMKVKNGQYKEYADFVKKAKPFYQERTVTGGAVAWSFAGLMVPSAKESPYDFSMVNQFPSMRAYLDPGTKAEAAFKKTMPGVDYDQFYKDLNNLREPARQEVYYLVEYAVKAPTATATK